MSIERIERTPMDEERLAALRELFPEVFTDGRVNVERLRELLAGEAAELGPDEEHYGLRWPGQKKARQLANRPATGTLRTAPGEGVDEATTQNLLVVGDNLEVLRILRKSYEGRVKLIYIDPPYNTGNDFIYKDDFGEPVEAYLEATGQRDFDGLTTSNPKTSGRFHSAWLSFMHPRLTLARHLLRADGIILISIDDNEVQNLRMIMDEVFGAENFIATVIWQKAYAPKNSARHFSEDHDFILVYAKHADSWSPALLARSESQLAAYKNPDDDPRGPWKSSDLGARNYYSKGTYSITCPSGRVVVGPPPGSYWRVSEEKFLELDQDKRIWWGKDGNNVPAIKRFLSEVKAGRVPQTLWKYEDVGHSQEAKKQLIERVTFASSDSVFDTPKPTRLIEQALRIGTSNDEDTIVLDFFAGSGTTGEAVMRLNAEDGGNRRFVLVQLPEVTGYTDYATIDQITKARLRAASAAIKAEQASKLDLDARGPQDLGFRVLHEARSQVQRWVATAPSDPQQVLDFIRAHNGLVADCNRDDLLIEVMLLEGWPLDSSVTRSPAISTNEVMVVEHPDRQAKLLVCLENEIYEDTVEKLADHEKAIFVCLEVALNDAVKVRIADIKDLRVKTL